MRLTCMMGLDDKYFREFRSAWVTYRVFRPELVDNDWLFVCDGHQHGASFWSEQIRSVVGSEVKFDVLPWRMPNVSQREKMLNGLSFAPSMCVTTDWFVKIDCDAFCVGSDLPLYEESWFDHTVPFVASPWSYTKPASMIDDLESWSTKVHTLALRPKVAYKKFKRRGRSYARHRRVISFVYYGNTEWHRWANSLCCYSGGYLPVASQDTFYSWIAAKCGHSWVSAKMKHRGWRHSHGEVLQQKFA